MVPRHPSCARIRLTEINGSLRTPVYTLQFFLPKNYALFKELPPPPDPPCGCRGFAEKDFRIVWDAASGAQRGWWA